jgi:hypothetical protein
MPMQQAFEKDFCKKWILKMCPAWVLIADGHITINKIEANYMKGLSQAYSQ